MSLTIQHLNADASFLLTFSPLPSPLPSSPVQQSFRILLDPWLTGASQIFHPKISTSTHIQPPCISSLADLPGGPPDVVIISQHRSDHCHEETMRKLPASGKTLILAEGKAAKVVRGWRYFDASKVRAIPRWEDGRKALVRIPIGLDGEVTVAWIPQRRDVGGMHGAVGITYRPPGVPAPIAEGKPMPDPPVQGVLRVRRSLAQLPTLLSPKRPSTSDKDAMPSPTLPTDHSPTPASPGPSLRSARSTSSLPFSRQTTLTSSTGAPPSLQAQKTLSVLFSPHGISSPSLHSYATHHLAPAGALPLTALLHCFDAVDNPWWLGGNVLLGAPEGRKTARGLGARCWVGAHDGDKDVRGWGTRMLRTRKFGDELAFGAKGEEETETEVLSLAVGEEVSVRAEGVVGRAGTTRRTRPPPPIRKHDGSGGSGLKAGGGGMLPVMELRHAESFQVDMAALVGRA